MIKKYNIKPEQAQVLEDLEKFLSKPILFKEEIIYYTFGVKIILNWNSGINDFRGTEENEIISWIKRERLHGKKMSHLQGVISLHENGRSYHSF